MSLKFPYGSITQPHLSKRAEEAPYQETEPRTTISFYYYFPITDPVSFRDDMYSCLFKLKVFGRIYIAHEGINAQISVPSSLYENLKNYLYSIQGLNGVRLNIAVDDDGKSFWVLKVKIREKIVADGIDDPDFDMQKPGHQYHQQQSFHEFFPSEPRMIFHHHRLQYST